MWGMIATWRMALEGVQEAVQTLEQQASSGDAIEVAIINQSVMGGFLMK